MAGALEKKLRAIRLRCGLNVLLIHAAVVLAIAGAAAALALLGERLFSVAVVSLPSICVLAGATVALIALLSWLRMPDNGKGCNEGLWSRHCLLFPSQLLARIRSHISP